VIELEGRCFMMDAFPKAIILSESSDPWSV